MEDRRWELAAKTYCKNMGIDPDKMVGDSSNNTGAWVTRPQWLNIVDELKRHRAMHEAVEFAKNVYDVDEFLT